MPHILLVEPDRILASSYCRALENDGHVVVWVVGAQSAIAATDHNTPDIIILELQLVLHNGIELLYELRSYVDLQRVAVIIMSNIPKAEFSKSTGLAAFRIERYLYKPKTTLQDLRKSVKQALTTRV